MITFRNKGQAIAATNFWDSAPAQAGYCFLTWNAGAARLLLPDPQKALLPEMRGARSVIISRGPWTDQGGRDALELMFEGKRETPFCLHLVAEQADRLVPEEQVGGGFVVTVWTPGRREAALPGPLSPCRADSLHAALAIGPADSRPCRKTYRPKQLFSPV